MENNQFTISLPTDKLNRYGLLFGIVVVTIILVIAIGLEGLLVSAIVSVVWFLWWKSSPDYTIFVFDKENFFIKRNKKSVDFLPEKVLLTHDVGAGKNKTLSLVSASGEEYYINCCERDEYEQLGIYARDLANYYEIPIEEKSIKTKENAGFLSLLDDD
jgi:hypothetical protein